MPQKCAVFAFRKSQNAARTSNALRSSFQIREKRLHEQAFLNETSSFLSSQVVSNQVLSTYECLTTVFGMGTGGTTQLSPLDFFVEVAVNVCQSRCAFSLRSWDVFAYDLLPNRLRLLDRSAYPQNYTEDNNILGLRNIRVFHASPCLEAVSSGQRQPITCALCAWFLGHFRTRGVRGFASRIRRPCESSPRRISTGRLHALRRFHSPPINLIVFEAPYRITP